MLAPVTLTVPTDKPVQVFGNDANGFALISNVGGLDWAQVFPGPSDVVIGTAFALTNFQPQPQLTLLPATYLLLVGAHVGMPTVDGIYALALTQTTVITAVKGIRDL